MIRIAIVEDEIEMANHLSEILNTFFESRRINFSIDRFSDAESLLSQYQMDSFYDLIFMDIDLPKMDGMTLADKIRSNDSNVMIIFVTSLAQYAIKGYKVKAFDFLLKPITYYDFELCMEGALKHLNLKKFIMVKSIDSVLFKIDVSAIKYIEAMNHTVVIYTNKERIEERTALKKYIDLLKDDYFVLCHKSFLVNLKKVSEIDKNDVIIDGVKLPISRLRRKEFVDALNLYIGDCGDI